MANAYPVANKYSEDYYETLLQKQANCVEVIDKTLKMMNNYEYLKKALEAPHLEENLHRIGTFFQEISRKISQVALENYLHEIVTPGIPEFEDNLSRIHFWIDVCRNKFVHLRNYIYKPELKDNPSVLDFLWRFATNVNSKIEKICLYTNKNFN